MQKRRSTKISKSTKNFKFNLRYIKAVAVWTSKVAAVCLLAFVFVWFLGQQVSTVGDSMKPALQNGDVVLVNRVVYNATTPKRGDVIVFKPKGNDNIHYYMKRVIGLPGDEIVIDNDGYVYINGYLLEEPYISDRGLGECDIEFPFTVPENTYFLMGDHRSTSIDSRSTVIGCIPTEQIVGKLFFRVWPLNDFAILH